MLQENAVLKSELELLRLKCKNLVEENRRLRQASVDIVSSKEGGRWKGGGGEGLQVAFILCTMKCWK